MPIALREWQQRRQDRKTEVYWASRAAAHALNGWERFQQERNFIESDYGSVPSNNGLDLANPAFAFDTKLAKFLVTI